ncbi:MAG: GNAT family N-acetyltransferase [Elusimicrobiota bacterium]
MDIRPATDADLPAVAAIAASQPRSAGWNLAQFKEALQRIQVLNDGQVRGYAVFYEVFPEAQLVDVAIRPDDEGLGLGRKLLETAVAAFKDRAFTRVTLEVSGGNEAARGLYDALGFKVVGRRPKFYNDGSDAILMDLDLS